MLKKKFEPKGYKGMSKKEKDANAKTAKENLIKEAKLIGLYSPALEKANFKEILDIMASIFDEESKKDHEALLIRIGYNPEPIKSLAVSSDENWIYIHTMIRYKIIQITENAMKIIQGPTDYFRNYRRYKITVVNDDIVCKIKQNNYLDNIYEILKNMEFTTVKEYGETEALIDKFMNSKLSASDKADIISEYPIIEILNELKIRKQDFTVWNILKCMVDLFYGKINAQNKADRTIIKQERIKFAFIEPFTITCEDVINYLGDSYLQNLKYKKGFLYDNDKLLVLAPGYKYVEYDNKLDMFDTETIGRNRVSPYITLFKNPENRNNIVEMLVVGENLHKNIDVSSNLARRLSLVYNVDMSLIDPLFSVNDPNIIGNSRQILITREDSLKYAEKGGIPFTGIEFTDKELEYRLEKGIIKKYETLTLLKKQKYIYTKKYKEAAIEYYISSDKEEKMDEFIRKGLNEPSIYRYIDALEEKLEKVNKVTKKVIDEVMNNITIEPDLLDSRWPYVKEESEKKFENLPNDSDSGVSLKKFLEGKKRKIYLDIQPVGMF